MKKEELIQTTKTLLESVPTLKESLEISRTNKVKLNRLIKSLNTLPLEDQKLIAYKYFENKKNSEIAILLHIDVGIVTRKLIKVILDIGHMVYGFEDEFFNEFIEVDETEKQLIDRAAAYAINKMKNKQHLISCRYF